MIIRETFVNATEGHAFGESAPYEPFTDDPGTLYRALQDEYGRCTGSIYQDQKGAPPIRCGWVFQGRAAYEDTGEPYLREVWVFLYARLGSPEPYALSSR